MICAFWDDLAKGIVYTYNDVANHRFIVQWEGFRSESGSGYHGNCTFQIILYDPAYHATATGDGPIEIMYEAVSVYGDETTYFTTGLQNARPHRPASPTPTATTTPAAPRPSRPAARCASCPSCRRRRAPSAAR